MGSNFASNFLFTQAPKTLIGSIYNHVLWAWLCFYMLDLSKYSQNARAITLSGCLMYNAALN